MALPDRIPVRISSEAAGSISITPVVSQVVPVHDLVETVLGTTGKDATRVREVLLRGAVVQGASRYRWNPLQVENDEIAALLESFPDADPRRLFRAEACIGARLRAGRQAIELTREAAAQRRLLKRRSFWDTLMELATGSKLDYVDYSYRTRTDQYRLRVKPESAASIRNASSLLRYSALVRQIQEIAPEYVEYLVRFP